MKRYAQILDSQNASKRATLPTIRVSVFLIVLLALGFFLGAASNAGAYQDDKSRQTHLSQEEDYLLFVVFHRPVPVNELTVMISDANIKVKEWTFRWDEYTGINSPRENMPLPVAGIEFANDYKMLLTSMLEQLETEDDPLFLMGHEKENEKERYAQIQVALARESAQIRQGLSYVDTEGLSMWKLTLQGKKDTLLEFVEHNKSHILSYEIIPISEYNNGNPPPSKPGNKVSDPFPGPLNAQSVTNLYSDPWQFAPEQGWVRNNTQTGAIESVYIWWDKSGFDSIHKGYEHDITIWADKGTYIEPGSTYLSNLPDFYADTTFLDDDSSFTVGSANATSIQPWQVYWSSVKLRVINPGYPYWTANRENVRGDIQPQINSWAGAYNDPEPPPELQETSFCYAFGFNNDPKWCLFADQTYTIGYPPQMYYDSSSAYVDFPFQHDLDRKYHWYKDYNAGWLQCLRGHSRDFILTLRQGTRSLPDVTVLFHSIGGATDRIMD